MPPRRAGSGCTRRCWMRPCTRPRWRRSRIGARGLVRSGCRSRGPGCRCMRRARRCCGSGCGSRRPGSSRWSRPMVRVRWWWRWICWCPGRCPSGSCLRAGWATRCSRWPGCRSWRVRRRLARRRSCWWCGPGPGRGRRGPRWAGCWPWCRTGWPGSRRGRLVVATRGAVSVAGEGVPDLAGAAVWGLVRSAQSEHPGRLVLADLPPGGDDQAGLLAAAVGTGEPELAIRDGQLFARRLARPAGALIPPGTGTVAAGGRRSGHAGRAGAGAVPGGGRAAGGRAGPGRGPRRRAQLPRRADRAGHVSRAAGCSAARSPGS